MSHQRVLQRFTTWNSQWQKNDKKILMSSAWRWIFKTMNTCINFSKLIKIVYKQYLYLPKKIYSKLLKIAQKYLKVLIPAQKNLLKIAQSCLKSTYMPKKSVQNCSKWLKMAQNCSKMLKMSQNENALLRNFEVNLRHFETFWDRLRHIETY